MSEQVFCVLVVQCSIVQCSKQIILHYFRKFPSFWKFIEDELNAEKEELDEVKAVFTALGFTTKKSIASIKTKKKIQCLENDFVKIRLMKLDSLCERFPALKQIDCFGPGLQAVMFQIIQHLNKPSKCTLATDDEDSIRLFLLKKLNVVICRIQIHICKCRER